MTDDQLRAEIARLKSQVEEWRNANLTIVARCSKAVRELAELREELEANRAALRQAVNAAANMVQEIERLSGEKQRTNA